MAAKDPRRSGQWKRLRLIVLERDGYLCTIRGPRCTRAATAVDHILPLSLGGEPFLMENLRAACATCNSGRRVTRPRRPAFGAAPPDDNYPGPSRKW